MSVVMQSFITTERDGYGVRVRENCELESCPLLPSTQNGLGMSQLDPVQAYQFAVEVVRKLRDAGYESLWAGGCVRDRLMGREPKDYDIATNATPIQIRDVFGHKRTVAIGASFGVITVVGPREAGRIDVATFRRDAGYSDGRHPDSVTFSTAEEDAQRRDFTINGLFYDPLEQRVIDFVGGQEDLKQNLIRAIGDAQLRFSEDKLRMLRAVRFASTLSFEIDAGTFRAIQASAHEITLVSSERIAEELRRMLVHPARHHALELLRSTRLLPEILPTIAGVWPAADPTDETHAAAWDQTVRILERLRQPTFSVAFAAVVRAAYVARHFDETLILDLSRDLRLSNEEREGALFVLTNEAIIRHASTIFWPTLQRILIAPRIEELLEFAGAVADVLDGQTREIEFCRTKLQLAPEQLNPTPLISGDDLRGLGIPTGPVYKHLLEQARDAQLMGLLHTVEEATAWVRVRWLGE
jgi:poly(A) polymerase